ncbi:MAG TPA: acyl-CoA dehydrogenase family protein [Acidimicrobiales bacterium]
MGTDMGTATGTATDGVVTDGVVTEGVASDTATADAATVRGAVAALAQGFAADRRERQQRDRLDPADLAALAAAGLQRTGLPVERGGLWRDVATSTRPICEIYRALARGDSSLALTTSMHPAVLAFWLATPEVPEPDADAWRRQRDTIFDTVEQDAWWGTITSEPGSGGDVSRTRTAARRAGDAGADTGDGVWRLTGQKHFGSGSGVTSYMLTTAVAEGEDEPDWFYVPVGGNPLDGSAGIDLVAPWDGHGMAATQSHALAFDGAVAVRSAWPGHLGDLIDGAGPFFGTLFTAVVLGIVDEAVELARTQLAPRAGSLRAYEQVEWAQAELEGWTMAQAYEGALRAIESGGPAAGAAVRAKTVGAQLAESCLGRLCKVLGGGTFSRRSPFGHWFEDVRALGFLRPPWGLAYDALVFDSLHAEAD